MRPARLRCEYRQDPLGVDIQSPRLSWILETEGRHRKQTACQILVSDDPKHLSEERGTLCDSGKVLSGESLNVVYEGVEPSSSVRCHWKVRVWDENDEPSPYSEPTFWEMGLLRQSDWKGQWIGLGEPVVSEGFDPRRATSWKTPSTEVSCPARISARLSRCKERSGRPASTQRFAATTNSTSTVVVSGITYSLPAGQTTTGASSTRLTTSRTCLKQSKTQSAASWATAGTLDSSALIPNGWERITVRAQGSGIPCGGRSASSHGIEPDQLEEHYRQRTTLKVNVLPEDVAEAVLHFASDRRSAKSTGNILNVDGGVMDAYPR